jgi:hypothetical protein
MAPEPFPLAGYIKVWKGRAAPFAELQSARLVGRGRVEVTPNYSYMDLARSGETAKLQDNFGLHVATGVADRADLRLRIDLVSGAESGGERLRATAFALGAKYALVPDRLALFVPIGFATGTGITSSQTWQVHPAVIWTVPLSALVEVNSSLKLLVPLVENEQSSDGGRDLLGAFNLGLGLRPPGAEWMIRPEIGFMRDLDDNRGTARHFSLGMSFLLNVHE